jgi:peptide/nickel transport system substrate-binding protein
MRIFACIHNSTAAKPGGNGNFAECKIPELDELLEQGRQSQDPEERVEIYRKACNIVKEESVLVPILLGKRQYATNKDLFGVKINPAMKCILMIGLVMVK